MPSTSPRCRVKDTSSITGRPPAFTVRFSTDSTTSGRGGTSRATRTISTERPTIISTSSCGVVSATARVPIWSPSRSTVTRSEISNTSSMRCEM